MRIQHISVDWANLDAVFLGRRYRLKCPKKYQLSCFFLNGISFLLNPNLLQPIYILIYLMNVCEIFWMIDDGFVEIMLVYLINLLGFPYFVVLSEIFFILIGVLVKRVYVLKTWGLWVLCISKNWFEWVCLIFIEFYHSLVLSWCFGLEGIWFQNLGFVGFEY